MVEEKKTRCPQKWGWSCADHWGGQHECVKPTGHMHPHLCKCGGIA